MARYCGAQVLEWVFQKGVVDPEQMTNLSKRDRELLKEEITCTSGDVMRHQVATDGVQKLLVEWGEEDTQARSQEGTEYKLPLAGPNADTGDPSRQTECVIIPTEDRRT